LFTAKVEAANHKELGRVHHTRTGEVIYWTIRAACLVLNGALWSTLRNNNYILAPRPIALIVLFYPRYRSR